MGYFRPNHLQKFERDGKVVIINPHEPSWIVTNKLGELIFDLFDGIRSVEEIVSIAIDCIGESQRDRIESFCNRILNSNVLVCSQKHFFKPYKLHIIHLALSENCNLKCKYCYAAQRDLLSTEYLTLSDYKRIIDEVLKINSSVSFTLTGGEPLLNKNWRDIAAYIKDKSCECLLMSNGLLITDKNISDIKALFDCVYLSIDGSNSLTHSLTRGDNFDDVMRTIDLLENYNVPYSLSMTVSKLNIEDVENAAKKFGSRLKFAPIFPVSETCSGPLYISGQQYYQALKSASGVAPLSYCEETLDRSLTNPCHKCAMGDGELSISSTGDVYPCQLLHNESFKIGNVKESSVDYLYRTSKKIQEYMQLSVDDIEGCKDCAFRYICGGACRARSFYETGSILRAGEFCVYEKEAFLDGIIQLYSNNALI